MCICLCIHVNDSSFELLEIIELFVVNILHSDIATLDKFHYMFRTKFITTKKVERVRNVTSYTNNYNVSHTSHFNWWIFVYVYIRDIRVVSLCLKIVM